MVQCSALCAPRHASAVSNCGVNRGATRRRILSIAALCHVNNSPARHLIFWGLLAAVLGQGEDTKTSLTANLEGFDLNLTHNRTFAPPERDGPQAPSFSWSSQLCSRERGGEALVRSDSAGNVLIASGGLICKYGQNGNLEWVREATEGDRAAGDAAFEPRIAIGTTISGGRSLNVLGAKGEHILFVATDQGVHAMDVTTGSTLWKYKECGPVHSTPLVIQTAQCKVLGPNSTVPLRPCSKHMVVFGAEDERYYALTFNGTLIWTSNFLGTAEDGWPLRFAAEFGDNRVFVLCSNGLTALEVDGTYAWAFSQYHARLQVSTQGALSDRIKEHINFRGPVYSSGMVAYTSGQAFNLVDTAKGRLLRQLKFLEPGTGDFGTPLADFTTAPAWFGSQIFIGDSNSTLHSISLHGAATEPTVLWSYHMPQLSGLTPSSFAAQRKLLAEKMMHAQNGSSFNCSLKNCTTNCTLYCNSTNMTDCLLNCNLTNATEHLTSSTPPPTTIPVTTPEPAPLLQPVWDQPVVGKNGLVYVRGPTGLHVIDASTGTVVWVYASQPLDADGKAIAFLSELGFDPLPPGGKGFTQVHYAHAASTEGMCGGNGYPACQRRSWVRQASPVANQLGIRSEKGCNVSLSNESGCSPESALGPVPGEEEGGERGVKQIQCGGDWRHGQGHLTGDGSFVLPCRGTVQRICCAACSASIISDAEVHPGGNVSLRLHGALPRELETGLWCLWKDTRQVRFPMDVERRGGDHTFSDSVLIWTEANSSSAPGSETVVICDVPGAKWDFPDMFLPLHVVQRDSSGSLHFCSGGGVHMQRMVPPPPPSYVLHFVLGSIGLVVLLAVLLLRILKAAYVRQTEYGLLERKFSTIGLGGMKYEHYMRLLKFLKQWHMRHLPRVFGLWRRALRLEQVRRKLWISHDWSSVPGKGGNGQPPGSGGALQKCVPAMDAKDMKEISFILSSDYSRNPASRARVRTLMEQVIDAQPHRADLWQLYLNLELQAQENVDFRSYGGDLCVHIQGALVYQQPPSEYRCFASCASMAWSTGAEPSLDANAKTEVSSSQVRGGRPFFTYSQSTANYTEVVFDEETSFSVHRAFELEIEETLSLQLHRQLSDDAEERIRSPATIVPTLQARASEMPVGQLNLPVRNIASCRTTLEVELLEVYGITMVNTSAPKFRCFRGKRTHQQVSCKLECLPTDLEKGFVEETSWVDVQPTGRAALGCAAAFFLPARAPSTTSPAHPQQGVTDHWDHEEYATNKQVNIEQQRISERNRMEYVLQKGQNITLWSMSGRNEHLTKKDTSKREKGDVYNGKGRVAWQEEENIRKAWERRDRLHLSVLSRESFTERKLVGSCRIALKDLEHNTVYDQWLPLQGGDASGGFARVRLRRRDVQRGEMSGPLWIPLARLPTSTAPAMYVKVAMGFIPRQPDLLQVTVSHKREEISYKTAAPQLECHAVLQAGAIIRNIDLESRHDLSMEMDDHTSAVRVCILGAKSTQSTSKVLNELSIVPCPDAGARIQRIEEGNPAPRSWETLKIAAALGPRVTEARKEARILFIEWMRKHSNSKSVKYADFAQASLTSLQLHNALSEYGLTESEINELLLDTDENCDGIVTMHEFERYGMRFLNPILAQLYAMLTADQGGLEVGRQGDLMLLAKHLEISLSRLPTPSLYEALSFYCNRMKQSLCCWVFCCCCTCPGLFSKSCWCRRARSGNSSAQISGCKMGVSKTEITHGRKQGFYERLRQCWSFCGFVNRRHEDGSEDEDGQGENASLPSKLVAENAISGEGFSKTMKRGQQVNVELKYASCKHEQAAQVPGILDLGLRLTQGEYLDTTNSQDLIDATRALFLRILSCQHLTSRQISRFADQCEKWEERLKLANPHVLPATIVSSLSPVVERSFEDGFSFEEEVPPDAQNLKSPGHFGKRPILTKSRPSSARPAFGRRERPLSGRPTSARSLATKRPLSARLSGSITPMSPMSHQASPFASGRTTPEYQQVADMALWTRVSGLRSRQAASRKSELSVPGTPGQVLRQLKATVAAPAYLSDGSDAVESSSEGEISSDDSGGSAFTMQTQRGGAKERVMQSMDSSRACESLGKSQSILTGPTTKHTAIEARARRSILLQDKSVPWSEVVASGCLSTWTPLPPSPSETPSEMITDRLSENDAARQQGRRMLRAMSARRFRVDDAQGRPKTAHPSTQASRAERLGAETLEHNRALQRRGLDSLHPLKLPGSLDDDGCDQVACSEQASEEDAAGAKSNVQEDDPANVAEVPFGAGWNRGLRPNRNSRIRPYTAGAHSVPHSLPSDLRVGKLVVESVEEEANPVENTKHAPGVSSSSMQTDKDSVPGGTKANDVRRPATAGRTISTQFAQSRQASLNRLLSLSGSTPVPSLNEEGIDVLSGRFNHDNIRAQSPFRLLEGRKKLSRDLERMEGASKACRPATAHPSLKRAEAPVPPEMEKTVPQAASNDKLQAARHGAAGSALTTAGGDEGRRLRPATAAPAGRVQLRASALDYDAPPRWAREGGITPSVHRLHCTLEDRADMCGWRNFDDLSPERKAALLSYMKPTERDDFLESPTNVRAQVVQKPHQPQPPQVAMPASSRPSTAHGGGTRGASPPRARASAGGGAKVKDIWKARANLKRAKARHDRQQEIAAEEVKWIYDRRIKVKSALEDGGSDSILLFGLGKDDYRGMASSVQGQYAKSTRMQCGRPVFERLGGMALWFAKDCEGSSQPSDKEPGDEGEWWVGPVESVGLSADVLLGPPARGVLRVRDSAVVPAKIWHTWRVFRE